MGCHKHKVPGNPPNDCGYVPGGPVAITLNVAIAKVAYVWYARSIPVAFMED